VWRSDFIDGHLFYTYDPGTVTNTGAVRVHNHDGHPVPGVMSFDSAIREGAGTSANGRIRLAKLDVEGGEYPILYTATRLELIDELVGEYRPWKRPRGPPRPAALHHGRAGGTPSRVRVHRLLDREGPSRFELWHLPGAAHVHPLRAVRAGKGRSGR